MARMVNCAKLGRELPGLEKPPFPGPIGARVVEEICQDCWAQWNRQQMMLINHYGLNLMDPQARSFLTKNMSGFLFGAGQQDEIDTSKQGTIEH